MLALLKPVCLMMAGTVPASRSALISSTMGWTGPYTVARTAIKLQGAREHFDVAF
jgi:hypothetical protein